MLEGGNAAVFTAGVRVCVCAHLCIYLNVNSTMMWLSCESRVVSFSVKLKLLVSANYWRLGVNLTRTRSARDTLR